MCAKNHEHNREERTGQESTNERTGKERVGENRRGHAGYDKSSGYYLLKQYDIFQALRLALAHRSGGQIARTILFEVMFAVIY